MIVSYNSNLEEYHILRYTETVILSPSGHKFYNNGQNKVYETWNFENREIYKWLEENCKRNFNYRWGKELEDGRILIHIGFVKEDHVKGFRKKFDTIHWNMECEDLHLLSDKNYELFYDIERYNNDDKFYDLANEAIQWCRENTIDLWTFECYAEKGIMFYIKCETDAMGFRLRFL